jgi:prevent-host-death family protein
MATIGAAKFKAECLGLLDEVKAKGTRITITKKGEPYAELVPVKGNSKADPLDFYYIGRGEIHGDLITPLTPIDDYEAYK